MALERPSNRRRNSASVGLQYQIYSHLYIFPFRSRKTSDGTNSWGLKICDIGNTERKFVASFDDFRCSWFSAAVILIFGNELPPVNDLLPIPCMRNEHFFSQFSWITAQEDPFCYELSNSTISKYHKHGSGFWQFHAQEQKVFEWGLFLKINNRPHPQWHSGFCKAFLLMRVKNTGLKLLKKYPLMNLNLKVVVISLRTQIFDIKIQIKSTEMK